MKVDIEFTKSYATEENATRAAEILLEKLGVDEPARFKALHGVETHQLRYMVIPLINGDKIRYGVLFVGDAAVRMGIHFHFNVVN